MEKRYIEGKKIRISFNDENYYYTISRVLETTKDHLIFLDKFEKEKIIRWKDIIEVF